jgi:hypothetical protein
MFVLAASIAATNAPTHALVVNPIFNSTITALPDAATIEAAFDYAADQYQGMYSNNMTMNITVGTTTSGVGRSFAPSFVTSFSTIVSKLAGLSSSPDQVSAAGYLPSSDPFNGLGTWETTWLQAKALGLVTANDSHDDGAFSFNNAQTYTFDPFNRSVPGEFDFIAVAEHEISELMGRTFAPVGSHLPFDLYRFSAHQDRSLSYTDNGTYFSINGGFTNLRNYNNSAINGDDPQDWDSSSVDSYDAFLTAGVVNPVTAVDQTAMHVLGYNPTSPLLNWNGGAADFFTDHNWSNSGQPAVNPHNGARLNMGVVGGFASHAFTAGENVTFSSTSDLGQSLEVSEGVVQFGVADTPSGPGYGLIIDQDASLAVDTNGVMYIAGPLVIANTSAVTDGHVQLSGNGSLHIGTVSGTDQTFYVGKQGAGTVTQEGNAAVSVPTLDVGFNSTASGSYSLSGTATLSVGQNEIIGDGGTGAFTQTGGTNTIGGSLIISNSASGGGGSVTVNGGTMQITGNAYVAGNSSGATRPGTLSVGGGTVSIAGQLETFNTLTTNISLASGTLSVGTLNLVASPLSLSWTGGTLQFTGEPLDFPGVGTDPNNAHPLGDEYTVNAGTLAVNSFEWICGDLGYLTIGSGGANSCPNIFIGSTGAVSAAFNLSGSLTSTNEYVGYVDPNTGIGGTGIFTQSQGTNTVSNVYVGYNSTGSYTLSSGTLAATNVSVSANGTFDQTGGSLTFSSFNQSGGTTTFGPGLTLSGNTFTLSAGTANFNGSGTLAITNTAGTNFSFTGGILNVNSLGNSTNFGWSGGTLNILSYLDVTDIADPTNHAAFGNSLTLNSAEALDVTSYEWLYGAGSSVTQNGGSNTTATLEIGNNNAAGNSSTYTMSGGTLATDTVKVGCISGSSGSGAGTFNQTGGTHSAKIIYVGFSGSVGGTYDLSGLAILNVHDDLVIGDGATGAFDQTGGTSTIGALIIETHTGTAAMSIGTLTANSTMDSGSITQTGGSASLGNVTGAGAISIGKVGGIGRAVMTVSSLQQNSVNILSTGGLQITGGTNNSVNSLSISGNGRLDITSAGLIINYGSGADPIASIEQWIKNGFYGLSGPQIISSAVTTDDSISGLSYGIGYADGADGLVAGLPSGEIEIAYTLLGDANLDGTVNSEDFTPFSHNLNGVGAWDGGDFNYDGVVNAEDFTPFSHNLNQSAVLAELAGVLETANGISVANVPEPACAGMIMMAGFGFLRRRRRSHPTFGRAIEAASSQKNLAIYCGKTIKTA